MAKVDNLIIRDARIIWRNFSGEGSKFNRPGSRNFTVIIDDIDEAERLREDGWNVRIKPPKEEGGDPFCTLQVTVKFEISPPKIVLIAHHKKVLLDEESAKILDVAELKKVDLCIRPYSWQVNGKSGIAAYLKTMYVTQQEDEFENDYLDDDELPFDI